MITLFTLFLLFVFVKRVYKEIKKILALYEATGLGRVKRLWFFNLIYMVRRTFIEWGVILVLMKSLVK